jgi:hypothetical protein
MDNYTKLILTVIAVALCVIAVRGLNPVPVAHASSDLECTVDGPMEIKGSISISSFGDDLEIKQGYSTPGSSSSSPVYTKIVD